MEPPVNPGARVIADIDRAEAVAPHVWSLGGAAFAFKYHGIVFYVNPSSRSLPASIGVRHADLVLCTQAGALDAAAIGAILDASPKSKLVLPKSLAGTAQRAGIPFARMTTTDADLRVEYFKGGVYARVYAVPAAAPGLDWTPLGGYPHLGLLVRCDRVTFYHAGTSGPYEGLAGRLRPYNVTVAMLPIEPAVEGCFSPAEAARLAQEIDAPWLVPIHSGASADAPGPLEGFVHHMLFERPEQRFKVFSPGEGWAVPPLDV